MLREFKAKVERRLAEIHDDRRRAEVVETNLIQCVRLLSTCISCTAQTESILLYREVCILFIYLSISSCVPKLHFTASSTSPADSFPIGVIISQPSLKHFAFVFAKKWVGHPFLPQLPRYPMGM